MSDGRSSHLISSAKRDGSLRRNDGLDAESETR
jgi:hypothetical protein